jgi:hypothetical protein
VKRPRDVIQRRGASTRYGSARRSSALSRPGTRRPRTEGNRPAAALAGSGSASGAGLLALTRLAPGILVFVAMLVFADHWRPPSLLPYPGYPVALGCRGTPITHHRIVPISLALDFVSSVSGYRGLWALNAQRLPDTGRRLPEDRRQPGHGPVRASTIPTGSAGNTAIAGRPCTGSSTAAPDGRKQEGASAGFPRLAHLGLSVRPVLAESLRSPVNWFTP